MSMPNLRRANHLNKGELTIANKAETKAQR